MPPQCPGPFAECEVCSTSSRFANRQRHPRRESGPFAKLRTQLGQKIAPWLLVSGAALSCQPAVPKRESGRGSRLEGLPEVQVDASSSAPRGPRDAEGTETLETLGGIDGSTPMAEKGMLWVPGGTFTMGTDVGGQGDERPAHPVTIAGFWLDRTEVTNAAYNECNHANVCPPPDPTSAKLNRLGDDAAFRGDTQPVSSIAWESADRYCRWRGKRLPTEAEWERGARGDDERKFPWGEDPATEDRAVFASSRTAAVGSRPRGAGPYGHLDLAGNVWEWVADRYDPYAYRRPGAPQGVGGSCAEILEAQNDLRRRGAPGFTGSNPVPTECERVLRGGAFNYDGSGLRATNRVHHPGRFHLVMSGFRCASDGETELDR